MEQIVQLNANAKLSEYFTIGEFTKSNSHPEIYNTPSHERNRYGAVWLHFAVRPKENRRKVAFIRA